MAHLPVEITDADRKRMLLGFRSQEFGLADPLAAAKTAGFGFAPGGYGNKFTVSFRDTPIAFFDASNRPRDAFTVIDAFPAASRPALTMLMGKVRDAAKAVDSVLKADARAMKTVLEPFLDRAAPAADYPLDPKDAFAIHATDALRGDPVRITLETRYRIQDGHYDAYAVQMSSPLARDNNMYVGRAFHVHQGMMNHNDLKVSGPVIGAFAADCASIYRKAVQEMGVPEDPERVPSDPDRMRQSLLSRGLHALPNAPGFSVLKQYKGFELVRDADNLSLFFAEGVILRTDQSPPGYDVLAGPGLTDGQVHHLVNTALRGIHILEDEVLARKEAEKAGKPTPEQLAQQAADVLSGLDNGYGF